MTTRKAADDEVEVAEKRLKMESEVAPAGRSMLETLPAELIYKVFEYTPELALDFRLTSNTLRYQIDAFATGQTTIPFVSKLSFSDFRLPNSNRPAGAIGLMFDVPADKRSLFFLRLALLEHHTFKEEMRDMQKDKTGEEDLFKEVITTYDVPLNVDEDGHDKQLETLNEWIGKRVGEVQFHNIVDAKKVDSFTKLFKNTQFNLLKIVADQMPEEVVSPLIKAIIEHKVDQLAFCGKFETEMDTVKLLHQFASFIRSIHIYQTPVDAGTNTVKRLFGANCDDWANVFIEMFKGKLDKLCISNSWLSGYLTDSGTDRLKDQLTKLSKHVWFMATCEGYAQGMETDAYKEYTVKVNPPAETAPANNQAQAQPGQQQPPKCKQFLHIIHKSREDERPIGEISIDAQK